MSYTDPSVAGTPAPGATVASAWGDDVQQDVEYEQSEITADATTLGTDAADITALQADVTARANCVFSGYRAGSAQTLTAGTSPTAITLDTAILDPSSGFSGGKWTVPTSGRYWVWGMVGVGSVTGTQYGMILKNGTEVKRGTQVASANIYLAGGLLVCTAGDVIALGYLTLSNSTSTLVPTQAGDFNCLDITYHSA